MKWIDYKEEQPPSHVRVLVCKWYIDADFDMITGGYSTKHHWVGPFIEIDAQCGFAKTGWGRGGTASHWLPIPPEPTSPPYELD